MDFTNSTYARKWKRLMSLHKDLSDLGASDFSPDLPRITVIGGQSAGKSSLVEAVSGIDVPRDSGTCTRQVVCSHYASKSLPILVSCPMECRLFSGSTSWSCMISLRFDHDSQGNRIDPVTEAYSPILFDKADVELWIRRAQATILSPHRSRGFFKTKSADEIRFEDPDRLKFSKNAILVNLKDPGFTDMAFVDLPGLIQNEDKELIDTVHDLVVERIQGKNTIILVAFTDDIETVMALRLAREADPQGERTIVAVTKADMMTTGASGIRQRWCDIISGAIRARKHHLRHGYYAVILPHDEARTAGETRAETQRRSREFFNTESPWRGVKDRKRFGVDNLVEYVSGLLVKLIEEAIPHLRGDISALLLECGESLRALPPQPQFECNVDVSTYILLRVSEFCNAFQGAVSGDPASKHRDLVHDNRKYYETLRRDIQDTRPDFRPWRNKDQFRSLVRELDAGKSSVAMDVSDVKEVIKEVTTWELPGHIPFEATKVLIHRTTQHWVRPSTACFERVSEHTRRVVNGLIDSHFRQFTSLRETVREIVQNKSKVVSAAAEKFVEAVVALDTKEPLFTQNTTDLDAATNTWNSTLTQLNHNWGQHALNRSDVNGVEETAVHNHDAIMLMARVRAYCEIASKVREAVRRCIDTNHHPFRIVDTVPLAIEQCLVQQLAHGLLPTLLTELEKKTPDDKKAMLDEDEEVAQSRRGLRIREDRLLKIQDRLDRWEAAA
ncbi:P-loop containing nucleoside triphosphate hydrolase protein [Schizophyllum fasciatum]